VPLLTVVTSITLSGAAQVICSARECPCKLYELVLGERGGTSPYAHLCALWSCHRVMVVGGVREECVGWAACEGGGVVWCISRYRKK
jgi:hypothetical protein